MEFRKELIVIRTLLDKTQNEMANDLLIPYETLNRWENEKYDIDSKNIEKIIEYAIKNKIEINKIYENLLLDLNSDYEYILFHGCKNNLEFPLDLKHSKVNNDFGIGFYLGESFDQASAYISNSKSNDIYVFKLNTVGLKIKRMAVNEEWMLAISYFRGWLSRYDESIKLKQIIDEILNSDVIIAPIADNRMFDIISEFVRGEITNEQCCHSLSATNLGMQYVIRNEKSISNLTFIKQMFLSEIEKKRLIKTRLESNLISQNKVKVAKIEYRGKGKYIDELLK